MFDAIKTIGDGWCKKVQSASKDVYSCTEKSAFSRTDFREPACETQYWANIEW